jgi:hypothetical protein
MAKRKSQLGDIRRNPRQVERHLRKFGSREKKLNIAVTIGRKAQEFYTDDSYTARACFKSRCVRSVGKTPTDAMKAAVTKLLGSGR